MRPSLAVLPFFLLVAAARAAAQAPADAGVAPDAGPADATPDAGAAPDAGPQSLEDRIAALEDQLATMRAERSATETSEDEHLGAENATELTETAPAAPQPFTLGGYAEAFYQWNANQPSNGITAFRDFDDRNGTFTVSNVVLDAQWDYENVVGRVALQVGHTPDSYYLTEPFRAGGGGAAPTSGTLWKLIQQAYVGYRFPVGRGLLVEGGIFLSPIGPEGMPVKDNWNWSRSDLFYGLPNYHTGVRVAYPVDGEWTLTLAGYNGWNNVVDDNDPKSVSAQATWTHGTELAASFIYFGGIERPTGAQEGPYWRHLFDAYATWNATDWLSLLAHADAGFEPNRFGTSGWASGALYARVQPVHWLFVTARVDFFWETAATSAAGTAARIFFPVEWVSSGTLTLDARPHDRVSIRLEYRHDQAAGNLYYGGTVVGDGVTVPYLANRPSQDTVTVGMVTWF